jgi:hypothetical protein
VQVALAASRTKRAYARALYQRIARHQGKKRAILAVANSLLQAIWYMLKHRQEYKELGVTYYEEQNKEQLTKALVKRLERLGHQVSLRQAAWTTEIFKRVYSIPVFCAPENRNLSSLVRHVPYLPSLEMASFQFFLPIVPAAGC